MNDKNYYLFHGVMYVYRKFCNISSFQYDRIVLFVLVRFDSYVVYNLSCKLKVISITHRIHLALAFTKICLLYSKTLDHILKRNIYISYVASNVKILRSNSKAEHMYLTGIIT